jgi:hypothetical protein
MDMEEESPKWSWNPKVKFRNSANINASSDYLWNEYFQTTCESIAELQEQEPVQSVKREKEVLDNYVQLRNLAQSFVTTATYLQCSS